MEQRQPKMRQNHSRTITFQRATSSLRIRLHVQIQDEGSAHDLFAGS